MITMKMHEYEYSENKLTRVRVQLLQNVFLITVKATLKESLCFVLFLLLCHYLVF